MSVRRIFVWTWLAFFAFLIAWFFAGSVLGQDFPDKEPQKLIPLKKDKPGAANLETCLKRAGERAKLDARVRSTALVRITATPSDAKEFQAFLVVAEFKDGSMGMFQGGSEESHDQYVIVEKDQMGMVGEACARTPR